MSTAIAKNFQVGSDGTATNNFTIRQPATPDGTVRIANGNSGTTTDLVTVTSAGNVGIGTSSPGTKLAVETSAVIAGTFTGASTAAPGTAGFWNNTVAGLDLFDSAGGSGYGVGVRFRPKNSSNTVAGIAALAPSSTSSALVFHTQDSNSSVPERMRLDASGNLGLGVTPSAWNSGAKALQISSTSSFYGTSNATLVGQNTFNNTSGNNIYLTSAAASLYQQFGGGHQFFTAPSGTAGNAISFTQAMTLNTNGALVLQGGNTSASGVGVAFPATQSASSDANTLDDYEEGAWTPGISAASGSGGTVSTFAGFYTKIGNRVILEGNIQVNSLGTLSGAFYITGLPFTSSSDFGQYEGAVRNQGINDATYGNAILVEALAGTAQLRFHFNSNDSTQRTVQVSNVSTGDFVSFGLVYKV